jgi:predicted Zn-dependent protease
VASRALLLLLALAAIGFLALGLRQADDQRRALAAVLPQRQLSPAQADRARRLLDRAGQAYPGVEPELLRGILQLDLGQPRQAARTLLDVVHREPQNIEAWAWLANAARDAHDTALLARARARILVLRPPVR